MAGFSNNQNSGIPQPASALKRSNSNPRANPAASRMSLAPGLLRAGAGSNSSGFGRPSEAADPMSTVQRESSRYSARKSYAPSSSQQPPPSQRRSSVMRRSSVGTSQANSFFSGVSSAVVQRDPRPLKEGPYKAKISQEILEYLLQNGFELEMKHTLSPTALKSPMQKDFVLIFQWLYHRLDPHYRFQKGIEHEVLPILKSIRYPYASSITKSQLTAVGSPNYWPVFLGILHWMLELIETMHQFQSGEFDHAATEEVDVGADRIIFRYLTRCYAAWLVENDDHEEYLQEMAASFEERQTEYTDELLVLEEENNLLKKQLEELEDGSEPLKKLEETRGFLEGDKLKFIDYIERLEFRVKKLLVTNEKLRLECLAADKELEAVEHEKTTLQEAVDRQGLTPADIDRMNTEREKLSKGLSAIAEKTTEGKMKLAEREAEAQSKLEALERAITRYNSLAYQIGMIPSTTPVAGGKEFELSILPFSEPPSSQSESNKLLFDTTTGYQPAHLLSRDLRNDIKPALIKLRKEIGARIHEAQDEGVKTQETLERISEQLADKREEVDTLHARVNSAQEEYQELKETMSAEGNASNAEIEKLEKELAGMRLGMRDGVLALEQRMQSVTIEYVISSCSHPEKVIELIWAGIGEINWSMQPTC